MVKMTRSHYSRLTTRPGKLYGVRPGAALYENLDERQAWWNGRGIAAKNHMVALVIAIESPKNKGTCYSLCLVDDQVGWLFNDELRFLP